MDVTIFQILRSRRRTILIEIGQDALLRVRAPFRAGHEDIKRFVDEKSPWIRRKIEEVKKRILEKPNRDFINGEELYFLGQPYKLNLVEGQTRPLEFKEGFFLSQYYQVHAAKVFNGWYKEQAYVKIIERVAHFCSVSGLVCGKVKVRQADRRWGSCGRTNDLNFNWRLIMAPLEVIDYVVIHEISHIVYKDHSSRFWQKVASLCPDYKKHRKWLKDNGHLLNV
jgi:hypothetical protein